ncbi:hypothetical protein ACFL2Q_16005 [Thermodesulfobacteriota bacterium]
MLRIILVLSLIVGLAAPGSWVQAESRSGRPATLVNCCVKSKTHGKPSCSKGVRKIDCRNMGGKPVGSCSECK